MKTLMMLKAVYHKWHTKQIDSIQSFAAQAPVEEYDLHKGTGRSGSRGWWQPEGPCQRSTRL